MPTLLDIGAFTFDEKAKNIPQILSNIQVNGKAIDALTTVLKHKLINNRKILDNIYFLDGRTGSGKSTLMITALYENLLKNNDRSIICAEPRIALARGNANDICRYDHNLKIGYNVGLVTGSDENMTKINGIQYCTSAILNNMLQICIDDNNCKRFLKKWQIIVIDEVHTLGQPEIVLLLTIRNFLLKFSENFNLPFMFIFTSATIDIQSLINYYLPNYDNDLIWSDYFMIGHIKGSMNFKVDEQFIEEESTNCDKLYNESLNLALTSKETINVKNNTIPCRDILIFCHSNKTIETVSSDFIKSIGKKYPVYHAIKNTPMTNLIAWRSQYQNQTRILILDFASCINSCADFILSKPIEDNLEVNLNEIKVIVSTPVIESGKTISTLHVCIDNGLHLKPVVSPLNSMTNININTNYIEKTPKILPIDMFMMTQRLGRIGREAPGIFIHNYTKKSYNKLDKSPIPEFQNTLLVSQFILPLCKSGQLIDVINKNHFVQKYGIDTAIYTNFDIIAGNMATLNGIYMNLNIISNTYLTKNWIRIAQFLYMICGYNLLDALVLSSINSKHINEDMYLKYDIDDKFKVKLSNINNINKPDDIISTAILEAYNLYKLIKYNHNSIHNGLPYLKEKYVLSKDKDNE